VRAVIDTNIWVSGLILPASPSGRVLAAVRDRRLEAVTSWELAEEIVEVLRRPKLARYGLTETDVRDVLELLGPLLPRVEVDPPLRDPGDVPVVAAAVAGAAQIVVTGDNDLLADTAVRDWLAQHGIEVVTAIEILRKNRP
jgi:uncharacterized protein